MSTKKKAADVLTSGNKVVTFESLEAMLGEPLTFGDLLRSIRSLEHEMTQAQFARLLKMPRQQLCDLERGRRLLSVPAAVALARRLGQLPRQFAFFVIRDRVRAQMRQAGIKGSLHFDVAC